MERLPIVRTAKTALALSVVFVMSCGDESGAPEGQAGAVPVRTDGRAELRVTANSALSSFRITTTRGVRARWVEMSKCGTGSGTGDERTCSIELPQFTYKIQFYCQKGGRLVAPSPMYVALKPRGARVEASCVPQDSVPGRAEIWISHPDGSVKLRSEDADFFYMIKGRDCWSRFNCLLQNIPAGVYTARYRTVEGHKTPVVEAYRIGGAGFAEVSGLYVPVGKFAKAIRVYVNTSLARVKIRDSEGGVVAGIAARNWRAQPGFGTMGRVFVRRDGRPEEQWLRHTVVGLGDGEYQVVFEDIPNCEAPEAARVTVGGAVPGVDGAYECQGPNEGNLKIVTNTELGSYVLTVFTEAKPVKIPASGECTKEPETGDCVWMIKSRTGALYVEFEPVEGYETPDPVPVQLSRRGATVTGNYVKEW